MTSIKQNLFNVLQQAFETGKKVGRDLRTIKMIAVSKKKPVEMIREAYDSGQKVFGENYVQEFLEKHQQLNPLPIKWHFIGTLQRRKARDVVGKVVLIHSLESYQLAYEIDKKAESMNIVQACLLQINLSGETTKSGVTRREALPLLKELAALKHIAVVGLMTLPPLLSPVEKVRPFFRDLRELRDEINQKKIYPKELTELSMGMTHDFPIAIEEGTTLIRIGTAIFGERD